ncbi:MAG: alanine racemase [Flavobacteriales bacterium]|nr:alanine racemase [Flavobacteriales bacterium]
MARIELKRSSLLHNFMYLQELFGEYEKNWGVVTKILCGNELYLKEIAALKPQEIHDSRLSNLEKMKAIAPEIQRVYIKPPPVNSLKRLVACADVSFNTHISTIQKINREAERQGVVHKIIIMIELGELREGVMREDVVRFYEQVFDLKHIDVIGIGSNLNCLNGILPSMDKLIQLSLYAELINAKFNSKIEWITAGSSITLPLLRKKQVPSGCNHFRVGETLYFGNDIIAKRPIRAMRQDIFTVRAEIIEIRRKPKIPSGEQGTNLLGEKPERSPEDEGKESIRAIIDIGILDVAPADLVPLEPEVEVIGGSSDMIVVDVGENTRGYVVGDLLSFRPNYTGVLSLMNSEYIEKMAI